MVRNRHLAPSISDATRSTFRTWIEYFGKVFSVVTVAVPPHYTSQNCSSCGKVVKKTLSVRTHVCQHCGHTQDWDWNAARNILELSLLTVGHTGTSSLELENASGDIDLCISGETPQCKPSCGKRKPKQ